MKSLTQCNNLGILPSKLGSICSSKPDKSNKSKIVLNKQRRKLKERQGKYYTSQKKLDKIKVCAIQQYINMKCI